MFDITYTQLLCLLTNALVFYMLCCTYKQTKSIGSVRTFYLKTAFVFPDKREWVGLCTYYNESDLQEAATNIGMPFGEYIQKGAPSFEFKGVEPVSFTCIEKLYKLPKRLRVSEESLKKYKTIIFANRLTVAIMVKPGDDDPQNTYWFGTCIQSDKEETITRILKEYRKRVKSGDCYIVRA